MISEDPDTTGSAAGRRTVRAVIALAIGLAEPYIEIAWKCRQGFESTEACVWGKSFFSLAQWLVPLIVTPVVYVVLSLIAWSWRQWRARAVAG